MKKISMVLLLAVIITSCGQGSNDEAAQYKKQVDSLTAIVAGMPAGTNEAFAVNNDVATTSIQSGAAINAVKIDTATANDYIQRWHKYVKDNIPHNMDRLSFIIDASVLRNFILNDNNIKNVVVYVGMKDDQKLTLIYVGAKNDANDAGKIIEVPFTITGDTTTAYAFDNVLPCPTCGKDGIHTKPMEK